MVDGEAAIVDGYIVIRITVSNLKNIIENGPNWPFEYIVTDVNLAAKSIVNALNVEEENGTTPIHRMIDYAAEYALEQGYEGFDETLVKKYRV